MSTSPETQNQNGQNTASTTAAATAAAGDAAPSTATTQTTPEVEGYRVYVGNLAFAATEAEVREHFSKVGGEILSVILPTRFKSRRPAGYAFVTFKDEADANKAVETLNESEIGDRKIQLQVARSKEENAERKAEILAKRKEAAEAKAKENAERKAAAKAAKEAEKTETSAQAGGDTTAVESDKSVSKASKPKKKKATKTKNSGRRRGPDDDDDTAVEEDKESSKAANKKKPAKEARIDGDEEKEKKEAKPKKEPKERKPRLQLTGENSKNTVFVANLPFTVDDEKLAELFSNLSIKVKSAHVIKGIRRLPGRRPFRGSKGFGFVELEDPSQQEEAVEKINGSNIGDRKVTAKVAQEMKPIEEIQAEQDRKDKEEAASSTTAPAASTEASDSKADAAATSPPAAATAAAPATATAA